MPRAYDKPKYKKFNIIPRFWDPEEEERQERERRVKEKLGLKDDDEKYIPHIKGKFKAEMRERFGAHQAGRKRSTVRVFFVLIILLIIAYYLVFKYIDIF